MISLVFCFNLQLAQFGSSQSCRAEIKSTAGDFCFSEPAWIEALEQRQNSPCVDVRGQWKAFSPPRNEVPAVPKKSITQFRVIEVRGQTTGTPNPISNRFFAFIEGRRFAISQSLQSHSVGLARAFLLGEKLSGGLQPLLQLLGLAQLLSETSIHFYFLGLGLEWAIQKISKKLKISSRFYPWIWIASLVPLWTGAWLLCGMKRSVLRACTLLLLRAGAKFLGMKWRRGAPILIAFSLEYSILLYSGSPPSFDHLSYAMVSLSAICAGEGRLSMSLGAWIIISVLGIFKTGSLSLVGPIVSLILIPVMSCFFFPAFLICGSLRAYAWMALLSQALDRGVEIFLRIFMSAPTFWILSPASLEIGIILASFLLVLIQSKNKKRLSSCALILGIAIALKWVWAENKNSRIPTHLRAQTIQQLDVGQGDSALVVSKEDAGLIDSGGENNLSPAAWLTVFSRANVKALDWIAVSHLDQDHSGGVKELAKLIAIRCVAVPEAELNTPRGILYADGLKSLGIEVKNWQSGCIPYPSYTHETSGSHHANQNMGAILVPIREGFYMNAGDAEGDTEIEIGNWAKTLPELRGSHRILKISHHGSTTSSEPEFLTAIDPSEAWISVGAGNTYGHPSLGVLARLHDLKIPVHRTDEEGMIEVSKKSLP